MYLKVTLMMIGGLMDGQCSCLHILVVKQSDIVINPSVSSTEEQLSYACFYGITVVGIIIKL